MLITARPTIDLLLRARAALTSNPGLRSIDRYRVSAEVIALVGMVYGRAVAYHERYLMDRTRFLPYSRDWLEARAGLSMWLDVTPRLMAFRFLVSDAAAVKELW